MSLYNMMNGVNQATFYILPMLGKHPDEYPRFRDCFVTEKGDIAVYTRVGGGNRGCGYGEESLCTTNGFITTYDDPCDGTYATYEFSVPEKWKCDFNNIMSGNFAKVSDEYRREVIRVFPKLSDKIEGMFSR